MGPVTDEMNAIPLPLEEELALVDTAEPEAAATEPEPPVRTRRGRPAEPEDDSESVDIVAVVDDLLEPPKLDVGARRPVDLLSYRPRS